MEKNNVIKEKSFLFAVRIVKLYKYLVNQFNEYEIPRQLLRSGTSIGANIEEALGGVSKPDFINKLSISYKESRETNYWLRLLNASGYINKTMFDSINYDSEELSKILFSIIRSTKSKKSNQKKITIANC
jgi:four helix bundle protein